MSEVSSESVTLTLKIIFLLVDVYVFLLSMLTQGNAEYPIFNHFIAKRGACLSSIHFQSCEAKKSSANPMWNLYNTHKNYFKLSTDKTCWNEKLFYIWKLKKMSSGKLINEFTKFKTSPILIIAKDILDVGEYILEVKIDNPETKSSKKLECWIKVVTTEPVIILKGGGLRNAHVGDVLKLDASETVTGGAKNLKFNWDCQINVQNSRCNDLGTGKTASLTVKGNVGDIFTVNLNVSSENISKSVIQQIKIVDASAPTFEITCQKNCLGKGVYHSTPAMKLFLMVECQTNCKDIKSYQWKITPNDGIDLSKATLFGSNTSKLLLKEGVLKRSSSYEIEVTITSKNSLTATSIWPIVVGHNPARGGKCQVGPSSGMSIITVFNIKCSGFVHSRPLSFVLQQTIKDSTSVVLAEGTIPDFYIRVGSQREVDTETVEVIIFDDTMDSGILEVQLKVANIFNTFNQKLLMKNIFDTYSGKMHIVQSVKALASKGLVEDAIQIINCLILEIKTIIPNSNSLKLIIDFSKKRILEDFLEFPIDCGVKGMISLLPSFVISTKPKNVDVAVILSKLALKLSKHLETVLKSVKNPLIEGNVANFYTSTLIEIGEFLLDGNFMKTKSFVVTTKASIEEHPFITENYPDYSDFVEGSLKEQYKEITENAMELIKVCAHAFSISLAYGELLHLVGATTQINIQSDIARNIKKAYKSDTGVAITLPGSMGFKEDAYLRVLFTSLNKSAFFWDRNSKNISTRIIDLIIYSGNEEVNRSLGETNFLLDIVANTPETFKEGTVTVPRDSAKWVKEYLNFNMTVHRVDVKKGTNLFVMFRDINPARSMQVVITKGRRPNFEDFKNAEIVRNNVSIVQPPANYDTWYYIAVLPEKSALNVKENQLPKSLIGWLFQMNTDNQFTLTYKYSVTTEMCLEWNGDDWITANCRLGEKTTLEGVHCKCNSTLLLAGVKRQQTSKTDDILRISFKIKPVINYMVYITTLIVFGSYCVALCFVVLRKKGTKKPIYFLSDNLKDNRYAYFIIVKTGKHNQSGTTSNITIKLYASKINSRAHVLNYPDPDKNILQQGNEDWFVLTSRKHLGEIKHIQLWFDSIGYRPIWYCESVKIYDLQTKKYWFFKVQEWFTVLEDTKHSFTIAPSNESDIRLNVKNIPYYFRLYFGTDNTWNLFLGSDDHNFTYIERITVILSHILCTYTIVLLICVTPEMRLRDGFNRPYFKSFYHIMLISFGTSFISFLINITFTILFRYSQRRNDISINKKKIFSRKIVNITWIILIIIITINVIYLISFGFGISEIAGFFWLTVTTISLLFSIFLWENIFLSISLMLKLILAKRFKFIVSYNMQGIILESEKQRRMLYSKFGIYALRPYLTHLYTPLRKDIFMERRRKLSTKNEIAQNFRDMVAFIMYMFFFCVLLLANLDSMSTTCNDHMEDMIRGGSFAGEDTLKDIQTIEKIYDYLNYTFLPTIHSYNWYGNWSAMDPGLMADFNTKVLGVARIRQKRVRENCCQRNIIMDTMKILKCYPEYSSYCDEFTSAKNNRSMWYYHSPTILSFSGTNGQMNSYSGGGYVVHLGRNLNNAYYMVQLIKNKNWIDIKTRALFIEFWTYNANRNMFNAVKIIIERSPTQMIMKSYEVLTHPLLYNDIRIELLTVILFSVFAVIIIAQTIKYAFRVIIQRGDFFKSFWNILDLTILFINISVIVLFIFKLRLVEDLLVKLEYSKHNEYVDYYPVFYYTEAVIIVLSVLICIATLRLWKFLRFGLIFRVFERTLVTASWSLLGVFVYNMIICIMFSFAGYVLFGTFSNDFRNLKITFSSLMLLCLNINKQFNYKILEDYSPGVGFIYYASYMLAMLTVLNVYITVIIIHYEQSRIYFSNQKRSYSIKDYFYDEWKYLSELCKRRIKAIRLRGGQDASSKVYPKADEHRYANCVLMSNLKMQYMATLATGVVHNSFVRKTKSEIDANDCKVMENIIRNLVLKKQKPDLSRSIFFKGRTPDGTIKFVSDYKILQMEYLVRRMLDKSEDAVVKKKENFPIKDVVTLKRINNLAVALNYTNNVIGNIKVVLEKKKKNKLPE